MKVWKYLPICLLIAPTYCQSLQVIPSAIADIDIIDSDNPAFVETLQNVIWEPSSRELLGPAIPYSVAVRSRSSRWIRMITVRYDFENSGEPVFGALRRGYGPDQFIAGSGEIFTPAGPLSAVRNSGDLRNALNHLEQLKASSNVTVSVDSIVFENGEIVGPDQSQTFEHWTAEGATLRIFLQEMRRLRGTDAAIAEKLAAVASAEVEYIGIRPMLQRRVTAAALKDILAKQGRAEFAAAVEKMLLNPPVLDVWRRSNSPTK